MTDIYSRIEKLYAMKANGDLTQAEFEQLKNNILRKQQGKEDEDEEDNINEETDLGLYPGVVLGTHSEDYRLVKHIGHGGMGELWQVEDLSSSQLLKETCYKAIKVLPKDLVNSSVHLELLAKEAELTRQLQHTGIINVYGLRDGIETNAHKPKKRTFILMDYLQGQDLERVIANNGVLSWAQTQTYLTQEKLPNNLN